MIDRHIPGKKSWYAVHCKPFKERAVVALLGQQLGLATYLPEIRYRSSGRARHMPFFPRYVFVRADLRALGVDRINATPGVLRLVSFGGAPQPITTDVIDALRERVERINEEGGLPSHNLRPGDAVRVQSGPLRGLEAVFVGPMRPSERVRVLIEFLGGHREAEVHIDLLQRVGEPAPARPPRRTRGKGRAIRP